MKKVFAVLAVAGLASAASAQVGSFTPQVAFRSDHNISTTPDIANGGNFEYNAAGQTAPVTLNFAVMMGVFNTVGFDNRGLFSWAGDLNGAGAGYTINNMPNGIGGARGPFNFSPAANGTVVGGSIEDLDLVRNPLATVPWPDGEAPEPASPQGRDQYFSIFRFQITLTDLTAREIEISTGNGVMTALAGWTFLGGEQGDTANWTAGPFSTATGANGGFTLTIIPAPGAMALLGLGGLVAARRRRA